MSNTVGTQIATWLKEKRVLHPLLSQSQLEDSAREIDRIYCERIRNLEAALSYEREDRQGKHPWPDSDKKGY